MATPSTTNLANESNEQDDPREQVTTLHNISSPQLPMHKDPTTGKSTQHQMVRSDCQRIQSLHQAVAQSTITAAPKTTVTQDPRDTTKDSTDQHRATPVAEDQE